MAINFTKILHSSDTFIQCIYAGMQVIITLIILLTFQGSGYLCSCMAQMVGKSGKVIGIDHLQGLVDLSRQNILKKDKYLLDGGQVKLFFGDGWDGCPDGK